MNLYELTRKARFDIGEKSINHLWEEENSQVGQRPAILCETGCEVPNYNNVIDLNIVSPNDITVLPKIKFQKPILFDNHPEILRLWGYSIDIWQFLKPSCWNIIGIRKLTV